MDHMLHSHAAADALVHPIRTGRKQKLRHPCGCGAKAPDAVPGRSTHQDLPHCDRRMGYPDTHRGIHHHPPLFRANGRLWDMLSRVERALGELWHSWHQQAGIHRVCRLPRVYPHERGRRRRALRPCTQWHKGGHRMRPLWRTGRNTAAVGKRRPLSSGTGSAAKAAGAWLLSRLAGRNLWGRNANGGRCSSRGLRTHP